MSNNALQNKAVITCELKRATFQDCKITLGESPGTIADADRGVFVQLGKLLSCENAVIEIKSEDPNANG
jgi:hypothetical protein